jgi:large subunit ribosomal protein L22
MTIMTKTAKANLRYLKIAPRKVRSVADLIRGRAVAHAQAQLMVQPRRAATPLAKLLASAIANAEQQEMNMEKLYISSIRVDQGPMMKRMLPKARGRGTVIQKIMSHVSLVLSEKEGLKQALFVIPRRTKQDIRPEIAARIEKKAAHDHDANKKVVKETKAKKASFFSRKTGDA